MTLRLPSFLQLACAPIAGRIAAALVVAIAVFAGARTAQATPVVYQFTAGIYTGWISYDPAVAVVDPNYTTSTSAVYRGDITDMYMTLGDGTNYNTFGMAVVVLDNSGGYYGLEFSGLSQWGHVDVDMFYYGDYEPITSTDLPLAIDQVGLSLFVYIGGQQATNASQQLAPTVQVSDVTPPVPEPDSLLIMGAGLIGLAALRKRIGLV